MKDESRFVATVSQFFLKLLISGTLALLTGGFGGRNSLVDGVTPSVVVVCRGRPLAVVKVASTKTFPQGVFEALLCYSSVALDSRKFTIQCDLWQVVFFHPGDMPFLTHAAVPSAGWPRCSTLLTTSYLQWILRMVRRQRRWKRSRSLRCLREVAKTQSRTV